MCAQKIRQCLEKNRNKTNSCADNETIEITSRPGRERAQAQKKKWETTIKMKKKNACHFARIKIANKLRGK